MNITFLIGNGFDLNLGLNTRYVNFIEEYISQNTLDLEPIKEFKNDLKSDKEKFNLWSNAEIAMGQYSTKVAERYQQNAAEVYCDLHDDFCEKLAVYLQKEQDKIDPQKIEEEFRKSFINIFNGFTGELTAKLKQLIYAPKGDEYNLIIFNYTTIIDAMLKENRRIASRGLKYPSGRMEMFWDKINDIIHVHGTTTDAMVLGVNDISQIGEPSIFDDKYDEMKNTFLKKEFNEMAEEGTFDKSLALLNKSDLIYIYGMSLGATDKIWWQQIYRLLKEKHNLHVIIQMMDVPNSRLNRRKFLTFERKQKMALLSYSLENDKLLEEDIDLLDRIHVTSYNIFENIKDTILTNSSVISNAS